MITEEDKDKLIATLTLQLQEKEKQVKKLNIEAQKYYEDAYCNDFHNQDKISFCIEKLEKVKWFVEDIDFDYGDDKRIDRFAVINEIDDQIEELKKEMK